MRYLSVCSGIEAASVAWEPLGWEAAAFSEIDPFPRAVLHHRFPGVPVHGDFTTIGADEYGTIGLLAGGTPCQSFSVAGNRGGMGDDRGNLALEYIRLAHRKRPRWVVWENVPGVFSSNGGEDFRCFLTGLVRWDVPLPEGGWQNSGVITAGSADGAYGVAWRVLDAQYFGVPQRRRRVFVVGYLGDWRRAAAVLLERESLSGDIAPRREKRPGVARSLTSSTGGCSAKEQQHTFIRGDGEPLNPLDATYVPDICGALSDGAHMGGGLNGQDAYSGRIIAPPQEPQAFYSNESYCDNIPPPGVSPPVKIGGKVGGPVAIAFSCKDSGDDASEELSPTLRSMSENTGNANAGGQVAVFDPNQVTHPENRSQPTPELCHTLPGVSTPPVAYSIMPMNSGRDFKAREVEVAQPLMGAGPVTGSQGGDYIATPYTIQLKGETREVDIALALTAGGAGGVCDRGTDVVAQTFKPSHYTRDKDGALSEVCPPLSKEADRGDQDPVMLTSSAVRRLTPRECERLQGFPDDWTDVPYRGKEASDGPRYKALGNSMAVPCMRWIGERIQMVEDEVSGG